MYAAGQSAWVVGRARIGAARRTGGDDRGEGVISAAIVVLIMAFLGAAMWVGFKQMWETTEQKVNDQVDEIGG
jgi:hypothetical protein